MFEPWHYRYVGEVHAKYIMAHEICLEEYIEGILSGEITKADLAEYE